MRQEFWYVQQDAFTVTEELTRHETRSGGQETVHVLGKVVSIIESAMPWALVAAPLIAAFFPGDRKQRLRRAIAAFLIVLLVGIASEIMKLFLSAEYARDPLQRSLEDKHPHL